MQKYPIVSWFRLVLATITATAIIVQLIDGIQKGRDIINFFSFFTIESNILAAILFLLMGLAGIGKVEKKNISFLRGAATLYMTMTGIIYMTLLAGNNEALQTTLPWVNMVLHYIMPVAVLFDWLLIPPRSKITYRRALLWMAFPIIYLGYSFIRGSFVGWYPYPFMNPLISSWPQVILTCLVVGIGVLLLIRVLLLRTPKK